MKSLLLLCVLTATPICAQDYYSIYKEALKAREEKDYPAFLELIQASNSLRPNNQMVMYSLAEALTLNEEYDSAIYCLNKVVQIDAINYSIDKDIFEPLKAVKGYQQLNYNKGIMNAVEVTSDTALVINDPFLHLEDIEYIQGKNLFIVSSINKRQLYSVTNDGITKPIMKKPFDRSPTGICLDDEGMLWVATAGFKQGGAQKKFLNTSVIYKIDPENGKVLKQYKIAGESLTGDLFINDSGEIIITDSKNNSVLKIDEKGIQELFSSKELLSIQGITQYNDLYIFSDYVKGIFSWSNEQGLQLIESPQNVSMKGIDGLYAVGNKLIAIQNGVQPNRVTEFTLDSKGTKIIGYKFYDKALPSMGEPTLGTFVDNEFYYLANSFWGLNKEGVIQNPNEILPVILKFSLDQPRYSIVVEEKIKVLNGHLEEAEYFYENNWVKFRQAARYKGIVNSFSVSKISRGEDFLILRTVYPDSANYQNVEGYFNEWIAKNTGPDLLNHLRPNDFRKSVNTDISIEFISDRFNDEKLSATCRTVDHRAFDFWLGNWNVYDSLGNYLGHNNVELVQNGCVIKENWFSGASKYTGSSYNFYDSNSKSWHQSWIDNVGGVLLLSGGIVDGSMVLISDTTSIDQNRITWTPKNDGSVTQLWESSNDKGSSWAKLFEGIYMPSNFKNEKIDDEEVQASN
ncbi:NHL repeat-containing protein [Marinigracilibium pacificum]|uniref:Uncharacterized protein n=1 Tax=Marinigracilibium pacificum TaxID=2729599 RepID=A0A848IYJ8_9BACT|nr:hypothetical protein [Marinigracilibium pacificum]NMM47370.1 hypothetical protein [Marinigracilibium pacificum]